SIFYMSTYQTDLLFVQENRLPIVFNTLSNNGLPIVVDEDLDNTPPDTPITSQRRSWGVNMDDIRDEGHSHRAGFLSEHSLATPPGSRDSSSDYDGDDDEEADDVATEGNSAGIVASGAIGIKQLQPLDIVSAHQRGRRVVDWSRASSLNEDTYDGTPLIKASPTTTTAIEIRQQAVRTMPHNCLRCVGLNTDLETGHQPWILKIIKILFYHDKIKEEAIQSGRGPTYDAPRFFSFTATSECVSMIADTYIFDEFEEHELFMDMETFPLRLIQLDLHCFGL
ncbi:hypothetical protein BGZ65_012209, partial [Modicella reniformis]